MPKGQNKKNRKRNNKPKGLVTGTTTGNVLTLVNNANLTHTRCAFPRSLTMFPDMLFTQGRTVINITDAVATAANDFYSFKANGAMFNYGPSFNGGSYTSNVPSGAANLLGSSGPYSQCWTMETVIDVSITGTGATSYATFLPSLNAYGSISGLQPVQLAEQRGALQMVIPGTTNLPVTYQARFNPWDIFGVTKDVYLNNSAYANTPGVDPANLAYFHIIHSVNTSDTIIMLVTITTSFKFAGINVLSTAQPT